MFDPLTADEASILERARGLVGKKIGEIAELELGDDPVRTKGYVGASVEAFFGFDPNSRGGADFVTAGIELKVAPIVKRGNQHRMKERISISLINYGSLVGERWETASVRKKLKILFVFFEHLDGVPKSDFVILRTVLWEPEGRIDALIEQDWSLIKAKVAEGRAHLLSESDGQILGPCTKGRGSSHLVSQPVTHLSPTAKPRAFALKPKFVTAIYRQARGSIEEMDALLEGMHLATSRSFEQQLLARFDLWIGKRVGDVAAELALGRSEAKHEAARVVRTAFGARERASNEDFEAANVTLRTSRISPNGRPYEATSFPAFDYFGLLEEEWEDSDLLAHIEQMLFVPIIGETKATPQTDCIFGAPMYWRPDADELEIARREWEMYRREIRDGKADCLTPASETRMIHVRPHARDSRDTRPAPGGFHVAKKSFWLNKSYVEEILARPR